MTSTYKFALFLLVAAVSAETKVDADAPINVVRIPKKTLEEKAAQQTNINKRELGSTEGFVVRAPKVGKVSHEKSAGTVEQPIKQHEPAAAEPSPTHYDVVRRRESKKSTNHQPLNTGKAEGQINVVRSRKKPKIPEPVVQAESLVETEESQNFEVDHKGDLEEAEPPMPLDADMEEDLKPRDTAPPEVLVVRSRKPGWGQMKA